MRVKKEKIIEVINSVFGANDIKDIYIKNYLSTVDIQFHCSDYMSCSALVKVAEMLDVRCEDIIVTGVSVVVAGVEEIRILNCEVI